MPAIHYRINKLIFIKPNLLDLGLIRLFLLKLTPMVVLIDAQANSLCYITIKMFVLKSVVYTIQQRRKFYAEKTD